MRFLYVSCCALHDVYVLSWSYRALRVIVIFGTAWFNWYHFQVGNVSSSNTRKLKCFKLDSFTIWLQNSFTMNRIANAWISPALETSPMNVSSYPVWELRCFSRVLIHWSWYRWRVLIALLHVKQSRVSSYTVNGSTWIAGSKHANTVDNFSLFEFHKHLAIALMVAGWKRLTEFSLKLLFQARLHSSFLRLYSF